MPRSLSWDALLHSRDHAGFCAHREAKGAGAERNQITTSRQPFVVHDHKLTTLEFGNGQHLVLRESETKDI